MRVLFAAFALCILSFAAGVAGDLSMAAPPAPSAIVRIPPPPPNAVHAHPLPPLRTASVRSEPAVFHVRPHARRPALEPIVARLKAETIQIVDTVKIDPDRAPKGESPDSAQI